MLVSLVFFLLGAAGFYRFMLSEDSSEKHRWWEVVFVGFVSAFGGGLIAVLLSAAVFLADAGFRWSVPLALLEHSVLDERIAYQKIQQCGKQGGEWYCDVEVGSRNSRTFLFIGGVVVKETNEVVEPTLRISTLAVPRRLVFLVLRDKQRVLLLPVGGLEQHYTPLLKSAQGEVARIEQQLQQVREFYAKNRK